jgi:hypothetical protein
MKKDGSEIEMVPDKIFSMKTVSVYPEIFEGTRGVKIIRD